MTHPDKKRAKRYDPPIRSAAYTDIVYSGYEGSYEKLNEEMQKTQPPAPKYNAYIGELHGHTNLSDGSPDIDTYFTNIRDLAKMDFCALSDHDHGGVGKAELWNDGKWELTKQKVREYYEPGKFTTILAYERDSYPYYTNMVVYYRDDDSQMLRGIRSGEITHDELHRWLSRDDIILVPHDSNVLSCNTDFLAMDVEDMPSLIQVYGRASSCTEYMGDPLALIFGDDCEGGHWQDALKRGARMGCIAGSDDHSGNGGLVTGPFPYGSPGITGVWAEENTREAIFDALKARRCYAYMGNGDKVVIDFRINGHYMGEEITLSEDPLLYYKIESETPVETVTVVKNCRDYLIIGRSSERKIYDYRQEQDADCYYLRIKFSDGRLAWTSPIWVSRTK